MHGLCFLLERVEIVEDCLSGNSSPTVKPATPLSQEGVTLAPADGEKPVNDSIVSPVLPLNGGKKNGDASMVSPMLRSSDSEKNGDDSIVSPVLPSSELEEARPAEGGGGGARGAEEGFPDVEGDDASLGRGSAKSSVAASGKGGQRDPQVCCVTR